MNEKQPRLKITELTPRLTVVGVGGAGCNAINNMITAGLTGVEFIVANTDSQSLMASRAPHQIQLGATLTEGLGAGAKPEVGEAAAEEVVDEIRSLLLGSHMVFVAAGMGGGTGTGATSVIARAAKEQGILTVGVVTKPFLFEGGRRMRTAEEGIKQLRSCVDTLIVIPNQNLFLIANEKTTFSEAFVLADHVLYSGIACIVDLIIKEGLINLDFADVRAVMSEMGTAMMGTGEASGERRSVVAAEDAMANPLLDGISLRGAKGLLLSITGSETLTLYDVDAAASRIREEIDPDANIIVGATFDNTLEDRVRVSIVASGMRDPEDKGAGSTDDSSSFTVRQVSDGRNEQYLDQSKVPQTRGIGYPSGVELSQKENDRRGWSSRASSRGEAGESSVVEAPSKADRLETFPAKDFQQQLAEAICSPGRDFEEDGSYAKTERLVLAEDTAATPSTVPWYTPEKVRIEDGPPEFMCSTANTTSSDSETGAEASGCENDRSGELRLNPPDESLRRVRRVPDVSDFSPHAQREYFAKATISSPPAGDGQTLLSQGDQESVSESEKRRDTSQSQRNPLSDSLSEEGETSSRGAKRDGSGVFLRLIKGITRWGGDSEESGSEAQATLFPEKTIQKRQDEIQLKDSVKDYSDIGKSQSVSEDRVELPVFFKGQTRR